MEGVKGMEIEIAAHARGATDAGDHDHLVLTQPEGVDGTDQAVQYGSVAAAGAPEVGKEPLSDVLLDARHVTLLLLPRFAVLA